MKNTVRTFALAGAMLLAATTPVFAGISGSDPRPPLNPPGTASVAVQVALTLLGL